MLKEGGLVKPYVKCVTDLHLAYDITCHMCHLLYVSRVMCHMCHKLYTRHMTVVMYILVTCTRREDTKPPVECHSSFSIVNSPSSHHILCHMLCVICVVTCHTYVSLVVYSSHDSCHFQLSSVNHPRSSTALSLVEPA